MSNEKKIKVIPGAKSGLAHESPTKSCWEKTSFFVLGKTDSRQKPGILNEIYYMFLILFQKMLV